MSNAFAIAAVTAALKATLRNALAVPGLDAALGGMPTVSALPPDRVNPAGGVDPNQLNVFLYSVTANPGWSNQGFPSRDASGERVANPPLALDLGYLLTAYSATDYGAEILLGHGMQALHAVPVFTRQWLRDHVKAGPPPNDIPVVLETAGLADQIEQIRITPKPLSTDEMSKIWTAVQGRYRPTMAYQVTVVLIESSRSRRAALPVLERNIPVVTWSRIRLDSAANAGGDTLPVTAGGTVRLRGSGLAAPGLAVRILGIEVSAGILRRTDTELDVTLPDPLPAGLRAGLVPVQVVQPLVGTAAFSSNPVGLLLRPVVSAATVPAANEVRVSFQPPVTARQQVALLLNQRQPPVGEAGRAFAFPAPAANGIVAPATETGTITFAAPGVVPGTYLVRLQVDGAESVLQVDAGGKFDQPQVVIP